MEIRQTFLKKRFFLIVLFFPALVFATVPMRDESVHPRLSNGTTAPADQGSEIGSELSSLPASVTRYMATRKGKETEVGDIYEAYGANFCHMSGFKCIPLKRRDTWYRMWPDEHKREIVMRLNRTNVALKYRRWLLVPDHLSHVDYMHFSPLPDHVRPTGKKLLLIDLRVFAFGAYDAEGDLVYWGPATGGKKWCSDTKQDCKSIAGKFKIYRMQGENCKSSKYPLDTKGGAPMPYCMHYYKSYAIHGSTLSGFNNRSRGCIRLFYSDAKWLNKDFVKLGTKVIVRR